jgi:hypothetical protein
MAFQKVEYEFPDEEKETVDIEIEPSSAEPMQKPNKAKSDEVEVEVEDEAPKPKRAHNNPPELVEDNLEVDVVDDTPKADRGRKPSEPPEDVTDEELEDYSEKVRKRIKHFSKGYHDERRAKEEALRAREELERLSQQLIEENKKLKASSSKSQAALIDQAKRNATVEVEAAKTAYKTAYDSGDSDAVMEAQDKLTSARLKLERISNLKVPTLQEEETPVQMEVQDKPAPAAQVDQRAADWQKANSWFGQDDEMTSFALGLHNKLVKQGVSPQSDDYYEAIDSRMRQVFPDNFEADETEVEVAPEPKRKAQVVAPATRSTAPKKVTLTKTQVQIAKRLGLTPQQYAKQVALDMRKQNG